MISADIFKTKYGKLSHTRVISLFSSAIVWGVWALISHTKGVMQEIPSSVALLLTAIITATITNTHFSESKKGESNATSQTSIS